MLSFQNLHQVIFNLSQATSAVTSGSVRFTSAPVRRKPEIDVACHESFLRSLNIFQRSENIKLFDSLPRNKLGSKLSDIQWIYHNNVNFKFTANKSVKEDDFVISIDRKQLELSSRQISRVNVGEKSGEKQAKLLSRLEDEIERRSRWSESFVSGGNFDENKSTDFRNASPVVRGLTGNANLFKASSEDFFRIQKRGFKTNRAIQMEEESKRRFYPIFGKFKESADSKNPNNAAALNKSNKYIEMMDGEELTEKDKLNLKVSFAEGYMLAAKEFKKEDGTGSKFASALKNTVIVFITTLTIGVCYALVNRYFPFGLGHHAEIVPQEVGVTFTDVKGVEEVKKELQEIVEFLRNPSKFSSMGGKLPKGVLLVGPPGTGKTLLARAVAGEANVPFFHASGAEFDEIFVGEGARRVRNLFRMAKARAPAIIFIDEMDCVGSKRKTTMLHPYANQTINQLLSEMDGFNKNEGIIVLGATNRKSDLDSALLRPGRFDVEILVGVPDLEGRKQILELYVSKILSKDIDVEKIAKSTAGCTGADLEAIINHAAIKAASDGAPYVTMEYVENAKDKIIIGPERKLSVKNEEAELVTAYHEGGHTVVAYFSDGAGDVDKVTILPRGNTLGHTAIVRDDDNYLTKAKCMSRMDTLLGGRAAEELVFGVNRITANAGNDLDKATELATRMVKKFGMSEKIGPRTLKQSSNGLVTVNNYGQVVSDQVDTEVKRLVQESYERAKTILKKHAKEHKLLAEALIKYKTLNPEDIRAILGEKVNEKGSSVVAGAVN